MLMLFLKRASIFGALFILSFPSLAVFDQPSNCKAKTSTPLYKVSQVFDGDTILLANGWKIRLIGINTPEKTHNNIPAQPFADDATRYLKQQILLSNSRIGLITGKQKKDHYGRILGHIFTADGDNLAAHLLEVGLGFRISIPPNLTYQDCYMEMEKRARRRNAGLWSHNNSLIINTNETTADISGFRLVKGIITRIGESRHYIWLNFGRRLALKINKSDLYWFESWKPNRLVGKHIEARGWITGKNHRLTMRINHPASITVAE